MVLLRSLRTLGLALAIGAVVSQPLAAQDQKGTLVFVVESLSAQTLDPILERRPGNAVYQAVMYDSLVGYDFKKGGIGPGVAERWVLSDDGKTWTFHLRPGQKFHNDDPLTAHDVKFSLERQMAPNSVAAAAGSMRRSIKEIVVDNDLTMRVVTHEPQVGLPSALSRAVAPEGSIMPKAYIEKVGEEEFRKKPIGSGPWKFVRNVPGDRIEFEAVSYPHWRGTPHFKNLHILQVPEESTRVAMVRTGEAAIASIGPETMLSAAKGGLEVLSVPGTMQALFQIYGIYRPEIKGTPVTDVRVREALSLAIDRKQIIEHVMNGKAEMPYPFAAFEYTENFSADRWKKWADKAYRFDPEAAKKLMADAGYPNGFDLNFANTALPGTQFMIDIGMAMADMWRKVGIRVNLKHFEWGGFPPLESGDQRSLLGWASMYRTVGRPDAVWRYNSSFSPDTYQRLLGNETSCEGDCKVFVGLYKGILDERNMDKRTVLVDKMVELVNDSWTAIPIIEGMGYYALNSKAVGYFEPIPGRHELGDVFERMPRPEQAAWKKKK